MKSLVFPGASALPISLQAPIGRADIILTCFKKDSILPRRHKRGQRLGEKTPSSPKLKEEKGPGAAGSNSLVALTASGHFNLGASGPDAVAASPPPSRWPAPPPHPHTLGDAGKPLPGGSENTAPGGADTQEGPGHNAP